MAPDLTDTIADALHGRSLPRVPMSRALDVVGYCDAHDVAVLALRGMRTTDCATCEDVQLQPDEHLVLDNSRLRDTAKDWSSFRATCNRLAGGYLQAMGPRFRNLQVTFDFCTEDEWVRTR